MKATKTESATFHSKTGIKERTAGYRALLRREENLLLCFYDVHLRKNKEAMKRLQEKFALNSSDVYSKKQKNTLIKEGEMPGVVPS